MQLHGVGPCCQLTPQNPQILLCIVQVIVSRMRTIAHQQEGNRTRIVGLSTSLANAKDLGEWIGATSNGMFNFPPGELKGMATPAAFFLQARAKLVWSGQWYSVRVMVDLR